jgi:site-specific recombinase XerD
VLDLPAPLAKRRKARLITLNQVTREIIADLLAFNQSRGLSIDPEAPLLQNRNHRRLTVRAIQRTVAYYRELAELDVKVTPHSLRHVFATRVLGQTNNMRWVQLLLGHREIRTTERYTHPGLDELKMAVAAIECYPILR